MCCVLTSSEDDPTSSADLLSSDRGAGGRRSEAFDTQSEEFQSFAEGKMDVSMSSADSYGLLSSFTSCWPQDMFDANTLCVPTDDFFNSSNEANTLFDEPFREMTPCISSQVYVTPPNVSSTFPSPPVESEPKNVVLHDLTFPQYLEQTQYLQQQRQRYGRYSISLPIQQNNSVAAPIDARQFYSTDSVKLTPSVSYQSEIHQKKPATNPLPPSILRRRASADHTATSSPATKMFPSADYTIDVSNNSLETRMFQRRASADHAHSPPLSFPSSDEGTHPSPFTSPSSHESIPRMGRRASADPIIFHPGVNPAATSHLSKRGSPSFGGHSTASTHMNFSSSESSLCSTLSSSSSVMESLKEESANDEVPTHCRVKQKGNLNRLRRPQNAFIMFSNYARKHLKLANRNTMSTMEISRALGAQWRALSKADRKYFEDLAEKTRAEFKAAHPEFRYASVRKRGKKSAADEENAAGVHVVSKSPEQPDADEAPPLMSFDMVPHPPSIAMTESVMSPAPLPDVNQEVQQALEEVRRLFRGPTAMMTSSSASPMMSSAMSSAMPSAMNPSYAGPWDITNEDYNMVQPLSNRRLTVPSFMPGASYVPIVSEAPMQLFPYYVGTTNVSTYYAGPNVTSYYLA